MARSNFRAMSAKSASAAIDTAGIFGSSSSTSLADRSELPRSIPPRRGGTQERTDREI